MPESYYRAQPCWEMSSDKTIYLWKTFHFQNTEPITKTNVFVSFKIVGCDAEVVCFYRLELKMPQTAGLRPLGLMDCAGVFRSVPRAILCTVTICAVAPCGHKNFQCPAPPPESSSAAPSTTTRETLCGQGSRASERASKRESTYLPD